MNKKIKILIYVSITLLLNQEISAKIYYTNIRNHYGLKKEKNIKVINGQKYLIEKINKNDYILYKLDKEEKVKIINKNESGNINIKRNKTKKQKDKNKEDNRTKEELKIEKNKFFDKKEEKVSEKKNRKPKIKKIKRKNQKEKDNSLKNKSEKQKEECLIKEQDINLEDFNYLVLEKEANEEDIKDYRKRYKKAILSSKRNITKYLNSIKLKFYKDKCNINKYYKIKEPNINFCKKRKLMKGLLKECIKI